MRLPWWQLASTGGDATIRIWDALTAQELLTLKGHERTVTGVSFSPDGRRLASVDFSNNSPSVRVWDAVTGQEMLTLYGLPLFGGWGGFTSVAFSPNGLQLAASAAYDGGQRDLQTIRVWDIATGLEVLNLKGHNEGVQSVSFSPNGQRLASTGGDAKVRIWDATTGQELLTFKGGGTGLSFSPDGRRLASASGDSKVRIWDVTTGQQLLTLEGHNWDVYGVSYSPDGQRLASASRDATVRVWDATAGQEILSLKGHRGAVHRVSFSPDGQRLASTGDDATVRIWDATTGQELLTFKGGGTGLSFSPDGRRLASAGADSTVLIWEASSVLDATWRHRVLVGRVATLFEKLHGREKVLAALRNDSALNGADRMFALEVAQSRLDREDPMSLNEAAWEVLKARDAGKEAYLRALRQTAAAVCQIPEDGNLLNTLGVAQYRAGRFADALATLTKAEKLNATKEGSHPADLAFLAMAQHQLGKMDEAKATLARLRTVMKQPRWTNDTEAAGFVLEAEELIEGKAAGK